MRTWVVTFMCHGAGLVFVVSERVLFLAPPKAVFQVLTDPTIFEEIGVREVRTSEGPFGVGFEWEERGRLLGTKFVVTDYQRRGLEFTATSGDLTLKFQAKKGGPGSCNAAITASGPDKVVQKWVKEHGDRLARLKAWFDGDD